MFAVSPLLSLISRTAAKTEFVELTSSVITPYLALMWSILTETQNKKMKENKKTTNSPRLRTILDCNFFSWDWFGIDPFLIFLKTILAMLANQLASILLFLWQAPSAIFGWPAVFMQILGTCPYTIRPCLPSVLIILLELNLPDLYVVTFCLGY